MIICYWVGRKIIQLDFGIYETQIGAGHLYVFKPVEMCCPLPLPPNEMKRLQPIYRVRLRETIQCTTLSATFKLHLIFLMCWLSITFKFRYLSVEKYVYEYDLRKITSPIINQPTRDLSPILQNQDEVNQLALAYHHPKSQSSKGKRKGSNSKRITSEPKLYIAASDDAGTLRFMDSASSTCSQVLKHDINAVVTTCAFRPSNQNGSLEIASGGTDCKVLLWDAFKPK